jgi:thiamine-phosphate pyrophosphorylase
MISKLHYITQEIEGKTHAQLAEEACIAGVDWVQLRVKNKSYAEWKAIAIETLSVCRKHNAKLIINDNVELAKEINANGVHLGKEDISTAEARKLLGSNFIIGGTANTFEDIKLHAPNVDYIGLGPFRFTSTKEKLSPVLGIEGYTQIINKCRANNITTPIIAIGGITSNDVSTLLNSGVYGIAIASAITFSKDKRETISQFLAVLKLPSLEGQGVGKKRIILPYNQDLVIRAKELRKNSTLGEILLWKQLKGKQRKGFDFDRQRVIGNYIIDFYCKDLMLAIEVDGSSHNSKQEEDANRQAVLENIGVNFLRFSDTKVKQDMFNVLREIDLWIDNSEKESLRDNPTLNPSQEGNLTTN